VQTDFLNQEIKFLTGVGPKRAELLELELNILTIDDLIHYFPYKYIDRSKIYKIADIYSELPYVQIIGKIRNFQTTGEKINQRLTAELFDETGSIELIWFKGIKWVKQSVKADKEYLVFGKPTLFNRKMNIAHPEIEGLGPKDEKPNTNLQATYNTSEKLKKNFITSKVILKLQQVAFQNLKYKIQETLPASILGKYKFMGLNEALVNIHFPQNPDVLKNAEIRLKFEELFFIQLSILSQKFNRFISSNGLIFSKVGDFFNLFYKQNLPFELTDAQKRVLKEIRKDLGSSKQMNRLLQGDVGSGKTMVALMAMLIAIDNNFQACLMAPTEILAQQHFESLKNLTIGLNINIELLTGGSKKKERLLMAENLMSGHIHILIGTHALIEDSVQFKNLGLVIIDEQHKFGVAQRAKLWKKNHVPPHVLVMTATPIPRTLAMTLYGDLEVSVIDELPPGRKPIQTTHMYDSQRLRLFDFLRKQIALGRQVYIVYPLINESEKFDYKDLTDGYESISRAFPPPQYAVSIVHGKMKAEEKEKAMNLFAKGITQIMVATTVIEVGVNVPNASVMVIESAERFGLSQLHQLRGRVGRGAEQSFCILMTSHKISNEGRKRLQVMVDSNDGFEIAEMDMQLRGPGDIEGTQQSGILFDLKIANLAKDGQLLQLARDCANEILDADPLLEKPDNKPLVIQLKKLKKPEITWGKIS